jgi:phosphoenolpyruvate carboxykinase (GTP)
MRVLKWIIDRCRGCVPAYETPVGWMPEPEDIDMTGLTESKPEDLAEALSLNLEEWKREVLLQDELFFRLYADLPKEMIFQRELLISRL